MEKCAGDWWLETKQNIEGGVKAAGWEVRGRRLKKSRTSVGFGSEDTGGGSVELGEGRGEEEADRMIRESEVRWEVVPEYQRRGPYDTLEASMEGELKPTMARWLEKGVRGREISFQQIH